MAVYFVTGKLGSGKTLAGVGRIRDYLLAGRRVATNLDLHLDKLLPRTSNATAIRLPDKPRAQDLMDLGQGCEEYDEDRFGLIVLDECTTWLNSRNWNDKERAALIDWFLHARKHFWDVLFLVQDIESIDKQLRSALCEHLVICRRLDRFPVPGLGLLTRVLTLGLMKRPMLPRVHISAVYYGENTQAMKVDRWIYRGRDLYAGYDTAQVFQSGHMLLSGELVDMRGSSEYLSSAALHQTSRKPHSILHNLLCVSGSICLYLSIFITAKVRNLPMRTIAARWGVLKDPTRHRAQHGGGPGSLRFDPSKQVAVPCNTATLSHK